MSLLERDADVVMTPDNIRTQQLPWIVDLGVAVVALVVAAALVLGTGIGNWVLVVVVGRRPLPGRAVRRGDPGRGPPRRRATGSGRR